MILKDTPLAPECLRTHYYRDPEIASNPIVEAIEELQGRVDNLEGCYIIVRTTDSHAVAQEKVRSEYPVVIFEKGEHTFSQSIYIPSNKTLLGYGAVVNFTTPDMVGFLNDSNGTIGGYGANKNITIKGFTFKATTSLQLAMIGVSHCENVIIEDCDFQDLASWHFVEFNATKHGVISNCSFKNYYSAAATEMIQLDGAFSSYGFPAFGPYDSTICYDIVIENCDFTNPVEYFTTKGSGYSPAGIGNHTGQADHYCSYVKIVNNHFNKLQSAMVFNNLHNAVIEGNTAEYVSNFFSTRNESNANYLAGVVISNNVALGYKFDYASSIDYAMRFVSGLFKNSIVDGNEVYGFGAHGITITGNDNSITNNRVSACARAGIYTYGDSDNIVISGNNCRGNCTLQSGNDGDYFINQASPTLQPNKVNISGNVFGTATLATTAANNIFTNNIVDSINSISGEAVVKHNNLINGVWTA